MGSRYCFLCKSASEHNEPRQPSGISGKHGGSIVCGLVYMGCRKLAPTCAAEAIGTGVLGGLCAYPVAKLLMGMEPVGLFVYVVPFLISTVAGSILAFILITVLEKGGALNQLRMAN